MQEIFGFASGLMPILAGYPYIRDILRGKTKPHRGSFFIWVVLGAITIASQFAKGATWSLLLPGADLVETVIILLLAIKLGTGGFGRRDVIGLAMAVIGLILWYFTKQPLIALLIVIAVDAVGTVLTAAKAYEQPDTETFSSWLLSAIGGLLAAASVGTPSFALLVYPLYFLIANASIDVAIIFGKRAQTS